jgi:hypothetical protein
VWGEMRHCGAQTRAIRVTRRNRSRAWTGAVIVGAPMTRLPKFPTSRVRHSFGYAERIAKLVFAQGSLVERR